MPSDFMNRLCIRNRGTIWMVRGNSRKRVKPDDIYINEEEGFMRGRLRGNPYPPTKNKKRNVRFV